MVNAVSRLNQSGCKFMPVLCGPLQIISGLFLISAGYHQFANTF
jgi:hypothetical protein